uniref:Uncharacterized protein n=1 Tax=Cannabis sativa TaxID=3483 RepID=A0A803PTA9_CANSA
MSEKILTRMVGSDTAAQIWLHLNEYYISLNRANVGHPLFAQDHIENIFNGLSSEYDVFVTFVNTRLDAYTVAEIETLLMAQEVRLEKDTSELDIAKVEANLAHIKLITRQRDIPLMDHQVTMLPLILHLALDQQLQGQPRGLTLQEATTQYANPETVNDSSWYAYSDATHHLTQMLKTWLIVLITLVINLSKWEMAQDYPFKLLAVVSPLTNVAVSMPNTEALSSIALNIVLPSTTILVNNTINPPSPISPTITTTALNKEPNNPTYTHTTANNHLMCSRSKAGIENQSSYVFLASSHCQSSHVRSKMACCYAR